MHVMQAMMLVMECATCVPAFWRSAALCSEVPAALLHCLPHQPCRPLRLTVHHGLLPIVRNCPVGCAQEWLGGMLTQLMAVVPARLGGMWDEMRAKVSGEVGGAKAKQTDDEIIQEVRHALDTF